MQANQRIKTVPFTNDRMLDLIAFSSMCREEGYKNNETIDKVKLGWCLKNGGQFLLTYLDDVLVSVSGCHPLPEVDDKTFRILFRGATLPYAQNYLGIMNKHHMNSIPFFYHVPMHVEWAKKQGATQFAISTNWENPNIPSMEKSHRAFQVLERRELVTCLVDEIELFNTKQTLWKLNLEKYFTIREEYKQRNNLEDNV